MNNRNKLDLVKERVNLALTILRLVREVIEFLNMVINYGRLRWLRFKNRFGNTSSRSCLVNGCTFQMLTPEPSAAT